jgi:release factor glutamine methyltransferase
MKSLSQNDASRSVLKQSQKVEFPYIIDAFNVHIEVHENVFSPKHFFGWEIFTRNFPDFRDKSVLEIGAGTGVTSIYLAKNGAKKVLATDISPYAVKNIKSNIKLNGLTNIEARQSDIYDKIKKSEKFDYIYWNMPFMPIKRGYEYKNVLERGLFDPGYEITERFIKEARNYLNSGGKILLGTGGDGFGDIKKLHKLAKKYDFSIKLIVEEKSIEIKPVNFLFYELF